MSANITYINPKINIKPPFVLSLFRPRPTLPSTPAVAPELPRPLGRWERPGRKGLAARGPGHATRGPASLLAIGGQGLEDKADWPMFGVSKPRNDPFFFASLVFLFFTCHVFFFNVLYYCFCKVLLHELTLSACNFSKRRLL